MSPGGSKGTRPDWARLLPETLRPLGYRSYHSGKWHIDGMPVAGGFNRSYYLRDQGRFFNPQVHWEDDGKLPPIEPGSSYYATTAIADHAIRILKQHAAEFGDQPFFHYLAFTAPHFPLHALPQDISRYRDRYRRDWAQIRRDRWRRIREMGIVSGRLPEMEPGVGADPGIPRNPGGAGTRRGEPAASLEPADPPHNASFRRRRWPSTPP